MEGVKSLTVDLDPVGLAEQDALDCFGEISDFTMVAEKGSEELARKVFLQDGEERENRL